MLQTRLNKACHFQGNLKSTPSKISKISFHCRQCSDFIAAAGQLEYSESMIVFPQVIKTVSLDTYLNIVIKYLLFLEYFTNYVFCLLCFHIKYEYIIQLCVRPRLSAMEPIKNT